MSRGEITSGRHEHLESLLWLAAQVAECRAGLREDFAEALRRAEDTWRRLPPGWDSCPLSTLTESVVGPSRKGLLDACLDLIAEERGRPCRCTGDDLVELASGLGLDGLDVRTTRMLVMRGKEWLE